MNRNDKQIAAALVATIVLAGFAFGLMYTETHRTTNHYPYVFPDVWESDMHSTMVQMSDEESGSFVSAAVVIFDDGDDDESQTGNVLINVHIGESQTDEIMFSVNGYYAITDIQVDYGSESITDPPLQVSMYMSLTGTFVSFDPDILGTGCDVTAYLHLKYANVGNLEEGRTWFGIGFNGNPLDMEHFGLDILKD